MRLSRYPYKTIKETPSDAELRSHRLLIRGGYIKQVSSGIFSYMPLAHRVLTKIEGIIREEMNRIEGNEVSLPVVMPASLWQETGRYEDVGSEMLRFEDRVGRKMLLGMTHEEAATDLIRGVVSSYKQLPMMVYQFQTKFRDEARARGGLIRVREFVMKDAYSFHSSESDLDSYYQECYKAYERIFARCGLPVISVSSDTGMMGGAGADEFMALTPSGEDSLVICSSCDYKANREVARAKREGDKSKPQIMGNIPTPGLTSIEEVAKFLGTSPDKTIKSLVYLDEMGEMILCFIRGDLEVNETKLKNHLGAKALSFADEKALADKGLVAGYIGPQGLSGFRIILDESVCESTNLIAGANQEGYHTQNVNYGRDFTSQDVLDISSVKEGEACPVCGSALSLQRGIEVGNIFKLGTKYSSAMNGTFLDENGKSQPMIMGCYGIGVGRLMASVLEVEHEKEEVLWPISIAPFQVQVLALAMEKSPEVKSLAEKLYGTLQDHGVEVLFDDRKLSPGVKFKDSELIGCPIKVVVGDRALAQGGVELSVPPQEKRIVSGEQVVEVILQEIHKLQEKLLP
jgi:prolyl-tRNA synthetase